MTGDLTPLEFTPDDQNPDYSSLFIRASDLVLVEPEFVVHPLIETNTLCMAFGEPGCGKSFVALELAACIASGQSWHGNYVQQGTVIYIAGEGQNGLRRRLSAWERQTGISLDGAPIFLSKRSVPMLDEAAAIHVEAAVRAIAERDGRPSLIILDTLARNFGPGDENSTKDMGGFVAAIDNLRAEFEATVLIIHHTGHDAKARARGSSVMKAALDTEFHIYKADNLISLKATKMKEADIPELINLELVTVEIGIDKNGDPITSAALELSDKTAKHQPKRLSEVNRLGLHTYKIAAREVGMLDAEGNFAGLHRDEWKLEFYRNHTGDTQEAKRKAFQRVRSALCREGYLSVDDDTYRLAGQTAGIEEGFIVNALKAKSANRIAEMEDKGQDTDTTGTCPETSKPDGQDKCL